MRQPDDESPQQQIIREVHHHHEGSGFGKLKDAVFFAIVLAVGALIWSMNQRLTTIETMVKIIAVKSGVSLQ